MCDISTIKGHELHNPSLSERIPAELLCCSLLSVSTVILTLKKKETQREKTNKRLAEMSSQGLRIFAYRRYTLRHRLRCLCADVADGGRVPGSAGPELHQGLSGWRHLPPPEHLLQERRWRLRVLSATICESR